MDGLHTTDFFSATAVTLSAGLTLRPEESPSHAPLIVRHCADSEGVAVLGKVYKFRERRGGICVDVQGWVDAA
jgi:hypothetical protein